MIFPDHFTRLQERVAWEFLKNPATTAVTVLVSVPRGQLDAATDWSSFSTAVGPALLTGWGAGNGVSAVVGFREPLTVLRYPAGATAIPPASWEEAPLPLQFAAVALTIARTTSSTSSSPSFRAVGSSR